MGWVESAWLKSKVLSLIEIHINPKPKLAFQMLPGSHHSSETDPKTS